MSEKKTMAKCAVKDSEGNFLVLFRSGTHPRYPHDIDIPGGEVELGESPEEAIAREIREETTVQISPDMCRYITTIEDERRVGLLHLVELPAKQPTITLSWEHQAFAWLPAEVIKKTLNTEDAYMRAMFDAMIEL